MFYSNDKFCCVCLYESFILKLTNYDEAQPSQQGLSLEFPLFHFFIRGYEVDGSLQKPNAEIVCSNSNQDSNLDHLLKGGILSNQKITQTLLSHHILLYLVDLKVRYALPNNLCWMAFYTSISFSRSFLVGFSTLIYCLILHGWFGPHHDHGLRVRRASRQLSSISAPLARVFTHCICPHTLDLNLGMFSRRQSQISIDSYVVGFIVQHPELIYSLFSVQFYPIVVSAWTKVTCAFFYCRISVPLGT